MKQDGTAVAVDAVTAAAAATTPRAAGNSGRSSNGSRYGTVLIAAALDQTPELTRQLSSCNLSLQMLLLCLREVCQLATALQHIVECRPLQPLLLQLVARIIQQPLVLQCKDQSRQESSLGGDRSGQEQQQQAQTREQLPQQQQEEEQHLVQREKLLHGSSRAVGDREVCLAPAASCKGVAYEALVEWVGHQLRGLSEDLAGVLVPAAIHLMEQHVATSFVEQIEALEMPGGLLDKLADMLLGE
jgi:hypothetical protein